MALPRFQGWMLFVLLFHLRVAGHVDPPLLGRTLIPGALVVHPDRVGVNRAVNGVVVFLAAVFVGGFDDGRSALGAFVGTEEFASVGLVVFYLMWDNGVDSAVRSFTVWTDRALRMIVKFRVAVRAFVDEGHVSSNRVIVRRTEG